MKGCYERFDCPRVLYFAKGCHDIDSKITVIVSQGIDQQINSRGPDFSECPDRVFPYAGVFVSQGSNKRLDCPGILNLPEDFNDMFSDGMVIILKVGNEGFNGRSSDFPERPDRVFLNPRVIIFKVDNEGRVPRPRFLSSGCPHP